MQFEISFYYLKRHTPNQLKFLKYSRNYFHIVICEKVQTICILKMHR